ncbi:TPA: SpaA isopeptide-forming pilin-related protein [Streptococcus pyogenes]|uniref:Cell wall surface anchor family protein n=2 Tax=Bacteria TaxID=2 RepID=A0A8B6J108_STRPY|nr:SpaA isopeptide-forming pilin-related protein [Streptococcus pyogenes]VGS30892.1 cell wall surface anchor family protein [Streptococcus pyogenes]VHA84523.1 cell wall surface anchor family protein [Streptococcus pyogenes]VHB73420.1 cell wall surface anchor family protein [Streptococcus pyogenes]VHC79788.1 cell wall surface anchor family protein [Streptococcus pyogenes]VHD11137.1 cell wall surface anchor family protein [Streptococcus pyogenes]
MTKKQCLTAVFYPLLLCFLLLFGFSRVEAKDQGGNLWIQLTDYDQVTKKLDSQQPQKLKLWKLEEPWLTKPSQEAFTTLKTWDQAKLDSTFKEHPSFDMVFTPDYIEVKGIPKGRYFVQDIIHTDNIRYHSQLLFDIDGSDQTLTVLAKPVTTQVQLHKVDQNQNSLAQVGFRLYAVTKDGQEKAVPLDAHLAYAPHQSQSPLLYTDQDGLITVTGLPEGHYRFVEEKPLPGYKITKLKTDVMVKGFQLVTVTVVNEKDTGGFSFLKVNAKDNSALAGASFKITKRQGQDYQPVIQDGKELVVTSDKDGRFSVDRLDFGAYYAWEVKAPKGFVQLNEPVAFTVDQKSPQEALLVVKNRKRPAIDVPNTGDSTLYALLVLSAVAFGLGFYLTRSKEKQG